MHRFRLLLVLCPVLLCVSLSQADAQEIGVDEIDCLPVELNTVIRAQGSALPAGSSVRLYFRRLHPLGAFYYNRMIPEETGVWWSVFPRPERREQNGLSEDWWEVLRTRDWMRGRDREWLEDWLAERELEAAEYYATIHDAGGELVRRTPVRLVEVRAREDCPAKLTPRQWGWAANLTVGETTELQRDNPLFHWLCYGVVTRIRRDGVLHPDEFCRECIAPDRHHHQEEARESDRAAGPADGESGKIGGFE